MLDDKTKTGISAAAEKYAFVVPYDGSNKFYNEDKLKAYIAGAEAEAERSRGLVEALEYFIKDVKNKPNDTRYATALNKATEALNQYNNPHKMI